MDTRAFLLLLESTHTFRRVEYNNLIDSKIKMQEQFNGQPICAKNASPTVKLWYRNIISIDITCSGK